MNTLLITAAEYWSNKFQCGGGGSGMTKIINNNDNDTTTTTTTTTLQVIEKDFYKALFQDSPIINRRQESVGLEIDHQGSSKEDVPYTWEIENHNLLIIPTIPTLLSSQQGPTSSRSSLSTTTTTTATNTFVEQEGILHFEERSLYMLLALTVPSTTRLVFVTSLPIDEWILRYYLSLLPPPPLPQSQPDNNNIKGNNKNIVNAKAAEEYYKSRVHFYSIGDPSTDRSLTRKILDHPRLLTRLMKDCSDDNNNSRNDENNNNNINNIVESDNNNNNNKSSRDQQQQQRRELMLFRSTHEEEELARILHLPYYSSSPQQEQTYGTKPGSRKIFHTLGIPHPDGTYEAERDLFTLGKSIWKVLRRNPGVNKGIVKLPKNKSSSSGGVGNGIMDVTTIQQRMGCITVDEEETDEILQTVTNLAFETMVFRRSHHTWDDFYEELRVTGAIFEVFLDLSMDNFTTEDNEECKWPDDYAAPSTPPVTSAASVQVVICEDSSISVLSTHEEILDDEVYHGCEFPCHRGYRTKLMEYGQTIGTYLSLHGVRDKFEVEFICLPRIVDGGWDVFAVGINLLLTGNVHPCNTSWMTLKLLTHGHADPINGDFVTPMGQTKCYVSSDNAYDGSLRRLVPQDLYELMAARDDLHWNAERQTGTIIHMIGRMTECGLLSMTAIGNTMDEAQTLFADTYDFLVSEARGV